MTGPAREPVAIFGMVAALLAASVVPFAMPVLWTPGATVDGPADIGGPPAPSGTPTPGTDGTATPVTPGTPGGPAREGPGRERRGLV